MAKGGEFERVMSKDLSLWWTDGERDDIFWRTAGSGGRATVRSKKGKKTAGQCGDLTATDPIGFPLIELCTIECKKGYNSWNIKELIDSQKKKPELFEFIKQCEREREEGELDCYWLITKQDRRATLLFFDDEFRKVLLDLGIKITKFRSYIKVKARGTIFWSVKWDEFKKLVNPQDIIDYMEE